MKYAFSLAFLLGSAVLFIVSAAEDDESTEQENEVEDASNLQEDDQSPIEKRNLLQFARMIRCATGRRALAYNKYGNWCGKGGHGIPVDGVDRCCRTHDRCYNRYKHCKPKWRTYRYRIRRRRYRGCRITCRNGWGCKRAVCECDKAAVFCFARHRYNPQHKKKSWWRG